MNTILFILRFIFSKKNVHIRSLLRLETDGICSEEKLPSVSSINRIVRSNKIYDNETCSNMSSDYEDNNSVGDKLSNSMAEPPAKTMKLSNDLFKKGKQKKTADAKPVYTAHSRIKDMNDFFDNYSDQSENEYNEEDNHFENEDDEHDLTVQTNNADHLMQSKQNAKSTKSDEQSTSINTSSDNNGFANDSDECFSNECSSSGQQQQQQRHKGDCCCQTCVRKYKYLAANGELVKFSSNDKADPVQLTSVDESPAAIINDNSKLSSNTIINETAKDTSFLGGTKRKNVSVDKLAEKLAQKRLKLQQSQHPASTLAPQDEQPQMSHADLETKLALNSDHQVNTAPIELKTIAKTEPVDPSCVANNGLNGKGTYKAKKTKTTTKTVINGGTGNTTTVVRSTGSANTIKTMLEKTPIAAAESKTTVQRQAKANSINNLSQLSTMLNQQNNQSSYAMNSFLAATAAAAMLNASINSNTSTIDTSLLKQQAARALSTFPLSSLPSASSSLTSSSLLTSNSPETVLTSALFSSPSFLALMAAANTTEASATNSSKDNNKSLQLAKQYFQKSKEKNYSILQTDRS